MSGSLTGEVALVTGATGALGAAMCRDLARAGADVAVHHLDEEAAAKALAAELTSSFGVRATTVSADVTSWDQVAEAVAVVTRELGTITVLVNNAGFMEPVRIVDSELADWRRTLGVDLDGVFIVTRHVLPGMLETHGRIVNVSSQLAFKGAVDYVAYATAKAGVLGFTKALAREVGPRVRVNAIAPGPIDTPMVRPHATPEWVHARTRDSVSGRLGVPEEIGPAVVFLAGPGAELMHGQTLHLNGGGVMA
jgi:3-oxoacyl-[acyl-carrier protein] reductase